MAGTNFADGRRLVQSVASVFLPPYGGQPYKRVGFVVSTTKQYMDTTKSVACAFVHLVPQAHDLAAGEWAPLLGISFARLGLSLLQRFGDCL